MNVKELIEELKKFPEDHKVVFYEHGSVYDTNIHKVRITHYDKKNKKKIVTLSNI